MMTMSCFFLQTPLSTCGTETVTNKGLWVINGWKYLAEDYSAHVFVLVVYRHAKGHLKVARGLFDGVKQLDEGGTAVEGAHAGGDAVF